MPKILTWDLETSTFGFKADHGFILCGGIKELGKASVTMLKRDNIQPDPLNDKRLVIELYNRLSEADVWVTHNGKWFDIPFLNSRLLHWGHAILPPVPHFDTCETAFKRLKIKNSLEAVGEFLSCRVSKYKVSFDEWVRAYAGNAGSLQKIVKHCVHDVRLTEEVYLKMRTIGFKHPNLAVLSGDVHACPVCNKPKTLIRRGFRIGQAGRALRFSCAQNRGGCGAWSHGKYKSTGVIARV